MPKVAATITTASYQKVQNMAQQEGRLPSKIVADLIELGLKVKNINESSGENSEEKLWEDLFKDQVKINFDMLETVREILRMTYQPAKSTYKDVNSADAVIESIKARMTKYIQGRLKKAV